MGSEGGATKTWVLETFKDKGKTLDGTKNDATEERGKINSPEKVSPSCSKSNSHTGVEIEDKNNKKEEFEKEDNDNLTPEEAI